MRATIYIDILNFADKIGSDNDIIKRHKNRWTMES